MKKGLHTLMVWGSAVLCLLILPGVVYAASSNCVTVPGLRFVKTVGLGDDCATDDYLIVSNSSTEVTYCLTLENPDDTGTLWKWFVVSDAQSGLTWSELDSQSDAIPGLGEQVRFMWKETINFPGGVEGCRDNNATVSIGTYEEDDFENECVVHEEDRARVCYKPIPDDGSTPTDQVPGMSKVGLTAAGVLLIVAAILFIRRRQARRL